METFAKCLINTDISNSVQYLPEMPIMRKTFTLIHSIQEYHLLLYPMKRKPKSMENKKKDFQQASSIQDEQDNIAKPIVN